MMIRGMLFDLDGTLLDRDASLAKFVADQHDRITVLRQVDRDAYANRFIELDDHGYVWKDKVYRELIREFALPVAWEDLLADYVDGFRHHCIGFPRLHETLTYLKEKGLKLGMITNGFSEFQANHIRALGIGPYFDAILISEAEGLRKPDPDIFLKALGKLGLKPEEAAFVGDHPENDVAASRRVGMKGIWKADSHYDADFERDGTITELIELKSWLEELERSSAATAVETKKELNS